MARPRFLCLALALLTLVVFLPVCRHGFIFFDDPEYITDNRIVQAGLSWAGLKWAFTTWHASQWFPLTWLSHMLDCQLFGLDAGAHHLVNVSFHAASSVVLLIVLFRMTGALWPSAFIAALFAWHPLRVESVAWAAERKDVLCALFWMLTLWAYVRYVHEQGEAKLESRRPQPGTSIPYPASGVTRHVSHFYVLALCFFALGLLSKPMIVTLPFVLVLLDFWPLRRLEWPSALPLPAAQEAPRESRSSRRQSAQTSASLSGSGTKVGVGSGWLLLSKQVLGEKWPFFLLTVISCGVTYLAGRGESVSFEAYPLGLRLENALVSYGRYLLKTIWPANLAILYPLPHQLPWTEVAAAAAVLAAISWFAWRARRRQPYLLVGWLWFLGTLVPVIGLVQVGDQALADRFTYIPSIGLFCAVTFAACDWMQRLRLGAKAPAVIAGVVLAGCLLATERQLRFWQDNESLFGRAAAITADNAVAHLHLGLAFEQQGRRQEALKEYRESLRINPGLAQGHNNLANLLAAAGNSGEALVHYREALRLKPDAELAHLNLAGALVELGRYEEAMRHYAEAARLDPADPRPAYLTGKALLRQGRGGEAVARFHDALRLDKNHSKTLIVLARVLASSEDSSLRNGAEAVALAEQANALTGGADSFALDTLAMACAEAGRFTDARQTARKALDAAAVARDADAVSLIQEHLRLIDAGQPCREAFVGAPAGGTAQ